MCWKGEEGLPEVFKPKEKPWIQPEGAETKRIIQQVKMCPSGALSYYMNHKQLDKEQNTMTEEQIVECKKNGPLLVHGDITIKLSNGESIQKTRVTAFCRCGASSNKPYCDGMHNKIEFKD
jgi:hypothetical protein